MIRTHCLLTLAALGWIAPCAAESPPFKDRWFYASFNLQVEKQADELIQLITRASKAGYTGLVLADYKLNILDRVPRHYFTNLERVKQAARKAKLEIIPAVFPIGYSSGLLAHDPNLAEGLPVKNVPFRVKDGRAQLVPLKGATFRNGNLEEVKGNRFVGFSFHDDPGKKTFVDTSVTHGGKVSCRMENFTAGEAPNCRLVQAVTVRPHACYRFSAWVKTKNLAPAGNAKLLALGAKGKILSYQEGELKATQDWTQIDIVFNTLDETRVNLYAGIWSGRSGTMWIDDLQLEELSLVNVLRRPGCPLVVTSADGSTTYEEGMDFEPIKDAKLGNVPYAGEYSFAHKGPDFRLTSKSRIREDDEVRISWYHPVKTHSYQIMCCLSEPKVFEVLQRQAQLVHKHLEPKTWFFSHDEIRVAGWCKRCQTAGKTPGDLLAANIKQCVGIVRKIDPTARIVVWSDMFDPHHNAVDRYYLVNGSFKGSWQGLPRDVEIANWNSGKASASLKWFADRGHKQILSGFYDSDLKSFDRWEEAARGLPGITGFMYTTWRHDFSKLEAFGALMRRTVSGTAKE